jgi:hypothetical protein
VINFIRQFIAAILRLVPAALGLLLLTAAGLKAHGLAVEPVGSMGLFSTTEFQFAVVEFEILMAVWLLSGKQPLGSWFLAFAAFTCFACVSFYLGVIGETSCGCFGSLKTNPWIAFTLDVFVLVLLLLGRPDLTSLRENPRLTLIETARPAVHGFALAAPILLLFLGIGRIGFGSHAAAIAFLRGERMSVGPRLADLGEAAPGDSRDATVVLWNWTDSPVRLIGGTADCSCTVLNDLPVTIPARESRPVTVRVRMSATVGVYTRKAVFLVDDDGMREVEFSLTGRIIESIE